ncbi:MAG: hypothetical protein C0440_05855 [Candidatus Pelagibacter sp.]|nr:hypothetical protein [Candidatus Pelagibacter sp.]
MIKRHTKSFKLTVVIEATRGDLTISQIVSNYQISESLIHRWEKQFLDQGSAVFETKYLSSFVAPLFAVQKLYVKSGELTLE